MRPSLLQTRLSPDRIRCDVCQWHCVLAPGETGTCRVRSYHDDAIIADADGLVSGATIGPVEDHRLWHFFPDSQVLSLGGYGTPLAPADTSVSLPYAVAPADARELSPERAAQFAQQRLCRGMLWTYGDPAVGFEWVLDGVKLGRAASRFTAIATTGYFSAEAFAMLAPYLDGMRLDVYGFTDQSYGALTGFQEWRTVFKNAAEARQRWNMHIEVALHLTPGLNDSDAEVGALAKWVRVALGSLTPLHVLGAEPDHPAIEQAQATAKTTGLTFVYGPAATQPTRCPRCTWVVVERGDGPTQLNGVADDCCESCGAPLGLRTSLFRRNIRYDVAA
jgi:pyruvate formate lyase activating enzyme